MRKVIGLLGGIGYQSTAEYYNRIMIKYSEKFVDMNYPEIAIYSLSHQPFKKYEDNRQTDKYVEYILYGIEKLLLSKADFIAMAANSPHSVIDRIREKVNIPVISALDSAANEALRIGFKKALLMGIKYTMQSAFYKNRFAEDNIELISPSLEDQDFIHHIIYDELLKGIVADSSRDELITLIDKYPVDGVVLGCMKLPILLKNGISHIKFVDTLDLHTTDILNYALGL